MKEIVPFLVILMVFLMCSKEKEKTGELEAVEESSPTTEIASSLEGKNILLIVAQDGFKDIEYAKTRKVLESAGANITVASNNAGSCKGIDGLEIISDLGFSKSKIDPSGYSSVVLIGGPGATKYLYHNKDLILLIKTAYEQGKVIGAICLAPGVLAESGILKGKKATVFDSPEARKLFDDNGVIYTGENVTIDGKIVTANGPHSAEDFGMDLVNLLK
ncbi:MAG: DJ-1/PfpI family protein [bacterium]